MRCFVAVDLDPSLTGKIMQMQNQIIGFDVKLVERDNLHFTLKFLGDVNESRLENINNALAGIASSVDSFSINLRGVGVFPSEKFIRVVWVGCGNKNFSDLYDSVNGTLAKLFKKEKAAPHLTIARVRSAKYSKEIVDFVNKNMDAEIGSMVVDKIKLKKSTLKPAGPVYEDFAVFELNK
jgi:2'-5' RNA ligase